MSRPGPKAPPPRGFTLVELMATVAIVGILATVAVSYGRGQSRKQQLEGLARGVLSGIAAARTNALGSGARTCMSLENGVVTAFVDRDGDRTYGSGDTLLYRYPERAGATVPSGMQASSYTLQEAGAGPQTAMFDGRGFYIDSWTGYSVHDANICIRDIVEPRAINVLLSRFGWSGVTGYDCAAQPVCPH